MNMTEFLSSLEEWHVLGLDDLNYDSAFDYHEGEENYEPKVEDAIAKENEAEEVDDPTETWSTLKPPSRARTRNYSQDEDVASCYTWMSISLDAWIGTDQSKDRFWGRIAEYYNNTTEVTSSRTQGSLGQVPSKTNATDGPVVLIKSTMRHQAVCKSWEYGRIIQDPFKQRKRK